ncbi:beta strand repeat-containing protein [Limnobacter parvus]|uniref:Filamentous hemagglutinin N-terminal domain-containing protein n=1 Tax=Limnobacter parvus TaxID=2939690 RepID=A0ABT1XIQ1_9BURK|nr:filamentous hemagglutinin N-terminal domain-containing protein [Limnobacter parvus]MCR2747155.1 filamentous hemagglutinin N-terminal domain-containing protein [Limnobacter parvus]
MNTAICTSTRSFPLKPLAASFLIIYAAGVQSAPVFQSSQGGNVVVTTPDATTTVVTQTGSRAVANWSEFSIDQNETVRFIQDNATSVILNRVTGEDISNIFGTLQANGRVFLINPNGIVFGANSQVSVGGLVASTLSLQPGAQGNNSDVELELRLDAASILNEGSITANDIVLIAPSITNNGTLMTSGVNGAVQLIAASEVTVDTSGDNLAFEVQAGYENALISQLGTVMAEGGRVVLLARPTSDSSSSVINLAGVNQAARITIDGNTVRLSGAINSGNGNGTLEVTAGNITQTAEVNVDNATLNATDSVALGDFNAVGTLTVNAENSLTLGDLTANRLVMRADSINQNADTRIAVANTTSLTARSVALGNAGNSFEGPVILNVAEQATLGSNADLAVQGTAGSATLNASNVMLGNLTTADDLAVTALGSVGQVENSTLTVAGAATLKAVNVDLDNAGNSFAEPVNLNVTEQTTLRGAGRLEVAGSVNNVSLEAQHLVLSNLAAEGNLSLKANTIGQTTDLVVQGSTRIENTGAVNLSLSNDFVGDVTLSGSSSATVNLTDRNNVRVGGQTGSVNITANGLEAGTGVVTLGNLRAQELTVNANTVRNADTNTFGGAVNVSGTTRLTAGNVELSNVNNNFGGQVALQVSEQATLSDANNLSVGGNAGGVTLNAGSIEFEQALNVGGNLALEASSITQDAALTVVGSTSINNTASVVLTNSGNDFTSAVELRSAGDVELFDRNSIEVHGSSDTLRVTTAAGTTTLGDRTAGELTAGNLVVNADRIVQNARVVVNDEATLNAIQIDLASFENDFVGRVILDSGVQANVLDANSLQVAGSSNATNLRAQTLIVDGLTTQGTANLTADVIRQEGALIANGPTNLKGGEVQLNTSVNNIFAGAVNVDLTGAANIRSSNNLVINGAAATVNADATNNLTLASLNSQDITLNAGQVNLQNFTAAGNLTLNGGTINQQGALTVEGTTTLGASNVLLGQQRNDFKGDVVLNNAGSVALQDVNTLGVAGRVNGSTTLIAESIGQTNALRTDSTLLLQANNVSLTNAENQFNGIVRLEGATQAALVSQGDLTVAGSSLGNVDFTAEEVMLNELGPIQQLRVAADEVKQGAALLVQGQTTLSANKVEFNNSDNDFVNTVVVQARSASNPSVQIRDRNSLTIQGENLALAAEVQGSLTVQANNLTLGRSTVGGLTNIDLSGVLTQTNSITLNGSQLSADRIVLNNSANRFNGTTELDSHQLIELHTAGDLTADTGSSTGALALNIAGNTNLQGGQITLAQSQFGGDLAVNANQILQAAGASAIEVQGNTQLAALGGAIDLQNPNNQFNGDVSANAEQTSFATNGDLRLLSLISRGGEITADGRLLLLGNIEQTGGTLAFTARGIPRPLSSAELALMLPPSLDVFSNKEAVNPISGFGRLDVASAVIDQQAGQISTAASATTVFNSTRHGSINLTRVNQINGRFSALSGPDFGQAFVYSPNRGASLIAVNNDVRLRASENGIEADLVAIRSRGLSTQGSNAVIHARMPYNDIAVGTSRSFPALTLSIPLSNSAGTQSGAAPFGESANSGQSVGDGAIRVELGDASRAGLGGFLTVLPFEGSNLLPGQVVYLAGPQRPGTQAFFYDGARSLDRIPVVYNGTLLLSPQENAALTTAQGAVVLARQEQTRSVVRTENVAGKVINGVVVEVGPGRPATEGEGGASKPASCDSAEDDLNCNL